MWMKLTQLQALRRKYDKRLNLATKITATRNYNSFKTELQKCGDNLAGSTPFCPKSFTLGKQQKPGSPKPLTL